MKNSYLIYLGFIIPLIFWTTVISCGLLTKNYNHFTNIVSELGATGAKTQYIFTIGLVTSAVLSIFFIIGLYRTAKEIGLNTFPILILLTFSFSILGAGIFPLPNRLHGILGSPSIILPLSPLFASILWETKKTKDMRFASVIIFLIMSLGYLTLLPIMDNYLGLKQRFFHIGWTFWFLYLGKKFLELNRKESPGALSVNRAKMK
ncbi:MAG: DUF998 domain-containing protein [Flavobacteriaceae bacterium]|nr:DUF998 domain-containing protein [Flavobacteriaceae bacterium]